MASKITCEVRFSRFRWNPAGYREVMESGAVQSLLRSHAEATRAAADAMLSRDGYAQEGHKVKAVTGRFTRGYIVGTANQHAYLSTLRHNTLRRAIR